MFRHSPILKTAGFAAIAVSLLVPLSANAGGGPWMSFEAPDQAERGPVLLVHAYHCGRPSNAPVTAKAEGLIQGRRQSLPLHLKGTPEKGVYAVSREWPAQGSWVLVFTVQHGNTVSAMVKLDAKGQPVIERDAAFTGQLSEKCLHMVRGKVTQRDVETALAAKM